MAAEPTRNLPPRARANPTRRPCHMRFARTNRPAARAVGRGSPMMPGVDLESAARKYTSELRRGTDEPGGGVDRLQRAADRQAPDVVGGKVLEHRHGKAFAVGRQNEDLGPPQLLQLGFPHDPTQHFDLGVGVALHLFDDAQHLGAEPLERVERLRRHRDVVGEQEAGVVRERLLADRRTLGVHHEQLVVGGELLHQVLEARGANDDARFHPPTPEQMASSLVADYSAVGEVLKGVLGEGGGGKEKPAPSDVGKAARGLLKGLTGQ
mgnify:CR=1 FL=1